jgi:CRISPR-associated protein Cas8a1/Csx13
MDSLTIDLFEPGMSILHRAGLGGLACSLAALNWPADQWTIDPDGRRLTLRWPDGETGARAFLQGLYQRAFGLTDEGMIHLPGAYNPAGIHPAIQAELQRGLSLTILQFGPNRKARGKTLKVVSYEVDGKPLTVEHQELVSYTHREAWRDLVTPKGTLRDVAPISGTIAPGFVQRHAVHAATTLEQPPGHVIALHFALVGTVSLPIGRSGRGVLIVPDVKDLNRFLLARPTLTPAKAVDCQIVSPADAALQAQVRLRGTEIGLDAGADHCLAALFSSSTWNPNQKARAAVLEVDPNTAELDLYAATMNIPALQPRVIEAPPEKKGDPPRRFWAGGIVRALIAENLAHHEPWFKNFRSLVVGPDGKDDEQRVRQLNFEKEGLRTMVEKQMNDYPAEQKLVRSIHEAMRWRFVAIRGEVKYDPATGANQNAYFNRRDRQLQEWRLALSGAKTPDDLRKALGDLWSRSLFAPSAPADWQKTRFNPVLRESWAELLPILCDDDRWQLNRDLALLALASYAPAKKEDEDEDENETISPSASSE